MRDIHARQVIRFKEARNAQLTHEIALLKRLKFAARSEKFSGEQQSLLEEAIDGDIAAIEMELEALSSQPESAGKKKPKRTPLPAHCSWVCQKFRVQGI
ncbi:hypothetical protein GWC77_27730 [Paraburkholderia sp. NMBU_R16]|nr:hypothetical protein [Paraburkholderia sp. NMBU_R16]